LQAFYRIRPWVFSGETRVETEDFLGQHQVPLSNLEQADLTVKNIPILELAFNLLGLLPCLPWHIFIYWQL